MDFTTLTLVFLFLTALGAMFCKFFEVFECAVCRLHVDKDAGNGQTRQTKNEQELEAQRQDKVHSHGLKLANSLIVF
jgi:hypothetical protein